MNHFCLSILLRTRANSKFRVAKSHLSMRILERQGINEIMVPIFHGLIEVLPWIQMILQRTRAGRLINLENFVNAVGIFCPDRTGFHCKLLIWPASSSSWCYFRRRKFQIQTATGRGFPGLKDNLPSCSSFPFE